MQDVKQKSAMRRARRDVTRGARELAAAVILAAPLAGVAAQSGAIASDTPTFSIEFHDGKIVPLRLDVPANTRFRIELHNTGVTAAEFESSDLHLEKVLAPNNPSPPPVLVIRSLDPGQYVFFDDLHPNAPKILLVAK